jgi:hypothetical protein
MAEGVGQMRGEAAVNLGKWAVKAGGRRGRRGGMNPAVPVERLTPEAGRVRFLAGGVRFCGGSVLLLRGRAFLGDGSMRFWAENLGFPARGVCFGRGLLFPEARACALAVKKTHFRKCSQFRWQNQEVRLCVAVRSRNGIAHR